MSVFLQEHSSLLNLTDTSFFLFGIKLQLPPLLVIILR